MTLREKYKSEHVGQNPPKHLCPQACGYEQDSYACDEMESCMACWDREVSENAAREHRP